MHDVALIGGLPSSGSTLLMHLLGKRDGFLCLPESGLFVHGRSLAGEGEAESGDAGLHFRVPWLDTGTKLERAFGIPRKELERAMSDHGDVFAVARELFGEPGCLLVEKTPENVFAFDAYLERNPEARVVVTTRDALGVTQSMMRRGFAMEEAFLLWFAHAYEACELMRKYPEQVYHCAYASLTAEPETVVGRVAAHLMAGRTYRGGPCSGHMIGLFDRAFGDLAGRAWGLTPQGTVRIRPIVNYLGNRFRVMYARTHFEVAPGDYVSAGDVEAVLGGERGAVEPVAGTGMVPIPMEPTSLLVETLLSEYRPCAAGG